MAACQTGAPHRRLVPSTIALDFSDFTLRGWRWARHPTRTTCRDFPAANPPWPSARAAVPDTGLASPPASALAGSGSARHSGGWSNDYRVWVISSLLVLAVALVFGQTVGHDFIGFDDQLYVYENTQVKARVDA